MANTATSILWTSAPQPTTNRFGREPEWTFYSQVSVSGPTGFSTEHRRKTVETRGSLALSDAPTQTESEDDYRDPDTQPSKPSAGMTIDNGDRGPLPSVS